MRSRIPIAWTTIFLLLLLASPSRAVAGEREKALAFLKENVVGRTVASQPETFKLANGKLDSDFMIRVSYANLVETKIGFKMDLISHIRQTIFELDNEGKRVTPGRMEDRILVTRWEVREMESTGRLIGFSQRLSHSSVDPVGLAWFIQIKMEDGSLVKEDSPIGYRDCFAPEGRTSPCSSDSRTVYSLHDGKLRLSGTEVTYDVDPQTFKRTATSEGQQTKIRDEVAPNK